MSRSRSRISMDWRPTSRSRSRAPESVTTFEQHGTFHAGVTFDGRFSIPALGHGGNANDLLKPNGIHNKFSIPSKSTSGTSSIPIPGASMLSAGRRSPSTYPHPSSDVFLKDQPSEHTVTFSNLVETRYIHAQPYDEPDYNSPTFGPSSLPILGFRDFGGRQYGVHSPSISAPAVAEQQQRSFPRHVRKTSFDHTISKDGILAGLNGRHQVNGKPWSPETLAGSKRRAEAPHYESMLRADPSNVDGLQHPLSDDLQERASPFPSGSFSFSFPPYEGIFDIPPSSSSLPQSDMIPNNSLSARESTPLDSRYKPSNITDTHNSLYLITSENSGGLSAAAAATSAIIAEGYATLNATNLAGLDDTALLDYHQFMGLVYPPIDGSAGLSQSPYTHVDPSQILVGQNDPNVFPSFQASPSSDSWGNGLNTSSNASPEPYNPSNASTPPSADGTPVSPTGTAHPVIGTRTYITRKQGVVELQKKKIIPAVGASPKTRDSRSTTATPDSTDGNNSGTAKSGSVSGSTPGGKDGEGEQPPTLCTNCHTTNTPLWRRDPEGQPLCECFLS